MPTAQWSHAAVKTTALLWQACWIVRQFYIGKEKGQLISVLCMTFAFIKKMETGYWKDTVGATNHCMFWGMMVINKWNDYVEIPYNTLLNTFPYSGPSPGINSVWTKSLQKYFSHENNILYLICCIWNESVNITNCYIFTWWNAYTKLWCVHRGIRDNGVSFLRYLHQWKCYFKEYSRAPVWTPNADHTSVLF